MSRPAERGRVPSRPVVSVRARETRDLLGGGSLARHPSYPEYPSASSRVPDGGTPAVWEVRVSTSEKGNRRETLQCGASREAPSAVLGPVALRPGADMFRPMEVSDRRGVGRDHETSNPRGAGREVRDA